MSERDYYEILGAARNASSDELKKSYRKLAMKYHPDRNPDDDVAEQKFKELNEAYEVLKDEQKRAAYDQYGHSAFKAQAGGGGFGGGHHDFNQFNDAFGDFFSDFMGGRGGGRPRDGKVRGSDLKFNMEVSLEDAFNGLEKTITFSAASSCDSCSGSGSKDSSGTNTCSTCQGHGVVRMQQGFFAVEQTCSNCQGTGRIIKNPCGSCSGQGRSTQQRNLKVTIPAGIEDGTRMRLSGEGEAGAHGGTSGDLYIHIHVATHKFFKVENSNLHCQVPINFATAALGGHVEIPAISGETLKVKVPSGSQNNDKLRVKGQGMSKVRSSNRGDLYVHLTIMVPTSLNKKQKELITELKEELDQNPSDGEKSFLDKVKDLWASN